MIVHMDYNNFGGYNNLDETFDLAMVKLKESLDMFIYTPACLPAKSTRLDLIGRTAWLVKGWGGNVNENNKLSHFLMETSQEVILKRLCRRKLPEVNPHELCAYSNDSCGGDSGGPLMIEEAGKQILIGVTVAGADGGEVSHLVKI